MSVDTGADRHDTVAIGDSDTVFWGSVLMVKKDRSEPTLLSPMTLESFGTMYMTGAVELPMTAAMGWMLWLGTLVLLPADMMDATGFRFQECLALSMSAWVKGLYDVALEKPLGQLADLWGTKK